MKKNMKRILSLTMALCLVACGSSEEEESGSRRNKNKETTIEQLNSMFHELNKFKVRFMLNENKIIICEI